MDCNDQITDYISETHRPPSKKEARLSAIIKQSRLAAGLLDDRLNFIYASPELTNIFAYNSEDMLGKSFYTFLHENEKGYLKIKFDDLFDLPGRSFITKCRFLSKDGRMAMVEVRATNLLTFDNIEAIVILVYPLSAANLAHPDNLKLINEF